MINIPTEGRPILSWCEHPEDGAVAQAKNLAVLPFLVSHVALMPDTHQGYGMPIGGVIACDGVVVPNVTNSACRIRHEPSGAEGQSQEQRNYKQNEQTAFARLIETPEFKKWHSLECAKKMGVMARVDEEVKMAMRPENIVVEVKSPEGRWVKGEPSSEEDGNNEHAAG